MSVIGTGYLGVVHAACMAELGHTVITVDSDPAKVESLSRGVAPMFEPGLDALLARVLPTGRLRFTTDYAELDGVDVHFICVGTPQTKGDNAADTSFVFAAAGSLAPPRCRARNASAIATKDRRFSGTAKPWPG